MEVQERLHEQLKIQVRLQRRTEEQSKYLQMILLKAAQQAEYEAFFGLEEPRVMFREGTRVWSKPAYSCEISAQTCQVSEPSTEKARVEDNNTWGLLELGPGPELELWPDLIWEIESGIGT